MAGSPPRAGWSHGPAFRDIEQIEPCHRSHSFMDDRPCLRPTRPAVTARAFTLTEPLVAPHARTIATSAVVSPLAPPYCAAVLLQQTIQFTKMCFSDGGGSVVPLLHCPLAVCTLARCFNLVPPTANQPPTANHHHHHRARRISTSRRCSPPLTALANSGRFCFSSTAGVGSGASGATGSDCTSASVRALPHRG